MRSREGGEEGGKKGTGRETREYVAKERPRLRLRPEVFVVRSPIDLVRVPTLGPGAPGRSGYGGSGCVPGSPLVADFGFYPSESITLHWGTHSSLRLLLQLWW